MHEYGFARELVAEVDRAVRSRPGTRASRIVVALRPETVSEDGLRAAFEVAKKRTSAEGAELVVETSAIKGLCLDCGGTLRLADLAARSCPSCGSQLWRASSDPAVMVSSVELEA